MRLLTIPWTGALLGLLSTSSPAAVPTKIMAFNPPDSISFVARTVTARTRYVDTLAPLVDSTFIITNYALARSGDGFLLTGTQVSTQYTRNGQKVENDVSRLSSNIAVTTELSRSGAATAVRGYEVLFARIDSLPDKTTADALRQVFSPKALASKDVNEWNSKMSHVIDKALTIGINRHDTTSMSVGDGHTLRFYSVAEFTDTLRVDSQLCLRVRIASDTDPNQLAHNLNVSPSKIGQLFAIPDSLMKKSATTVSGYHSLTELLINVETLLFLHESQDREVIAPVTTKDGRTVMSRMTESLDKQFDYAKR